MFLHNALHNRQAQPRAFFARGHIRLSQTIAVFIGKANAIVGNRDKWDTIMHASCNQNMAAHFAHGARLNRFAGIFNQIGDRLGHQTPVKGKGFQFVIQCKFNVDVRGGDALQHSGFTHCIVQIIHLRNR